MARRLAWLSGLALLGLVVTLALRQGVAVGTEPAPVATAESSSIATGTLSATPQPTFNPRATVTVVPPSLTPTTEWRSFTNVAGKYRFLFPPDWYVVSTGSSTTYIRSYDAPSPGRGEAIPNTQIKIDIVVQKKTSLESLEERLGAGRSPGARVLSSTAITVNGIPSLRQVVASADPPHLPPTNYLTIAVPRGDTVYIIRPYPMDSVYIGAFERILESFQFVD